jgi:hypothetical protein
MREVILQQGNAVAEKGAFFSEGALVPECTTSS